MASIKDMRAAWPEVQEFVEGSDRNLEIIKAVMEGQAQAEVARLHRISPTQVSNIVRRLFRRAVVKRDAVKSGQARFFALPPRLKRALEWEFGITTEEAVREYVEAHGVAELENTPNLGRDSIIKLCDFLGMEVPETKREKREARPVTESEYRRAKRLVERYEAQGGV